MALAIGFCAGQAFAMEKPEIEQTPPPVPPRTSSLPGKVPPRKSLPPIPAKPAVKLSEKEEHSIQKIEEDINGIIKNLISIAKNSVDIGKSAASLSHEQIISSAIMKGGPILQKIGSTSLLIANIIKHSDRLSLAKPEVREVAQKRILAMVTSEQFKTAVGELDELTQNSSIPSVIKTPLQKLSNEVKALPDLIVKKFLKK